MTTAPASRIHRLIAQFIDGVVAILPVSVLTHFSMSLLAREDRPVFAPHGHTNSAAGISFVLVVTGLLFLFGYHLFADSLPGGQSVGKRMVGIAVIDKDSHAPCSLFQSFVRNILLIILAFFDWIFIFGSGRQRLGDMAAGTIVIDAVPAR